MDWRKIAAEDLRQYPYLKAGYKHNEDRIRDLDERIARLTASGIAADDDRIIECVANRDKLKLSNGAIAPLVKPVEDSLELLSENERCVLTRMYINNEKKALDRLCEELCYEKSRIYQIRNEALRKFTVAMYGIEAL